MLVGASRGPSLLGFLLALRISLSVQKRLETITWTGSTSKHKIARNIGEAEHCTQWSASRGNTSATQRRMIAGRTAIGGAFLGGRRPLNVGAPARLACLAPRRRRRHTGVVGVNRLATPCR